MIDVRRLITSGEKCNVDILGLVISKIKPVSEDLSNLIQGDYRFKDVKDKSCGLQVYACNRIFKDYIYSIMGLRGVSSVSLILMLKDDCDFKEWLSNLDEYVIPYLVKYVKG